MADFLFNISRGRTGEFYQRVATNDGANSALIVMVLATSGLETDAVLKAKDTFADILSGTTNEVTNTGYARLTITDTGLSAFTPDDTNNRLRLDMADLSFGSITAGDGWSKLVMGWDSDTTAGTDANIVPMLAWDFVVVPDGTSISAILNTNGFYESSV